MDNPSNTDLARQITNMDRRFTSRFTKMEQRIGKFEHDVIEKFQPFHDYLVGQEAISKANKATALNINPDILKLLGLALAIIAALVGAKAIQ